MKRPAQKLLGTLAILVASAFTPPANADLFSLSDVNPDPNIFECDVTAIEKDVTIGGATVHAKAYKDENAAAPPASAGMPIQVIKVKVGEMIVCRFKNQLSTESASIHWHGIELDNDSDGTAVSQDAVLPGQTYTYQFMTFRPGLFWFHSHMMPGNTLFAGIYGVLIVENNTEGDLITAGTLPAAADTYTLALSDIEFDGTGKIGKQFTPTAGPPAVTKTENELIELCHLHAIGDPGGDAAACGLSSTPGSIVLVNGQKPDVAAKTPKFVVKSGQRIRLRLLNESISRHFRLSLLYSGAGDKKLYRIGGQGGLLDNILLDGGIKPGPAGPVPNEWDTKYTSGEINIGSGMRADVVIYPTGNDGDIIQLVGNPLTSPFNISTSLPANYPIAYFQISGSAVDAPPMAGDPILAGTAEDVENIKTLGGVIPLIDPAPFGGSSDETMKLFTVTPTGPGTFVDKLPTIDNFAPPLDTNAGNGDWLLVARPPTSRYAHVGDLLELTVRNESAGNGDHPYHLHGFSMQPVRMVDNATGNVLYNFDYDEFVDTVDVYGGQSYVFRVRIDDRPKICDLSPDFPTNPGPVLAPCDDVACGGAVGRWLFHCHIVNHGAFGMIGELTVLAGPDTPPEITCPANIVVGNDPGLCSAVVNFVVTASDDCGIDSLDVSPPSGSVFPVGVTNVTATATDTTGQVSMCNFTVTVEDREAPQVTSSVTTVFLFPPDHNLINVGFKATATDNCPDPVTISVKVFSDESEEAFADGNFSPDAKNIAPTTLRLRRERAGDRDGRVYLIVTTATDAAGNQAYSCATVKVPHSLNAASIASVNAQAAAAMAFCGANNGAAPPGFVEIGIGPVIGPKQ